MERIVEKVIEVTKDVVMNTKNFGGTGIIAVFFVLALLWIVVNREKQEKDKFILTYVLIVAIIYFFPVTAWIIMKCISVKVYWRMFWLLPIPIIIAYAIVQGIDKLKRKEIKITAVILAVVILAAGGSFLYTEEIFDYNGNVYGVPQFTVEACDAVMKDAEQKGISEYYIAVSEEFAPWVRQYAPSIKMLYGRGGKAVTGKIQEVSFDIYNMLSGNDSVDWDRLSKEVAEENCSYIVSIPTRLPEQAATAHGFRVVAQGEGYIVLGK